MSARASFSRVRRAAARAWHALRVWSGDAAYETYAAHAGGDARLDRRAFYVESLKRRYSRPTRCC